MTPLTIEVVEQMLVAALGVLRGAKAQPAGAVVQQAKADEPVADDAELDGQYGDPTVRKMPSDKYWKGEDFTGQPLSACPPEFLDAYAKYKTACAFMSAKDPDEKKQKYAEYDRRDAARARGWARRARAAAEEPAGELPF